MGPRGSGGLGVSGGAVWGGDVLELHGVYLPVLYFTRLLPGFVYLSSTYKVCNRDVYTKREQESTVCYPLPVVYFRVIFQTQLQVSRSL